MVAQSGSAPRVRGTPAEARSRPGLRRFSPACAGNAAPRRTCSRRLTVQPRVCGERRSCRFRKPRCSGSAPRVRGTRFARAFVLISSRFSPACAGNAMNFFQLAFELAVQPRVCGERVLIAVPAQRVAGSAPRVRGTRANSRAICSSIRFSPACAGNAMPKHACKPIMAVQPRVCGERRSKCSVECFVAGSAPRVRGTRDGTRAILLSQRFSPACAGNATLPTSLGKRLAVQPRVCGERSAASTCTFGVDGSAPRVRGTPWAFTHCPMISRFSPACAGNA